MFEEGVRPDQVAVLVPNKDFGAAMVRLLADDGHGANHIFLVPRTSAPLESPDEVFGDVVGRRADEVIKFEQSLKTAFAYGDQRLKVCTIHSFKGWEADHVVVVCPPSPRHPSSEDLAAAYVAFTRPRSSLTVIGVEDTLGLEGLLPEVTQPPLQDSDAELRFERYLEAARRRPSLRPSPRTVGDPSDAKVCADPEPVWEGLECIAYVAGE